MPWLYPDIVVIGHRGAAAHAPENTLAGLAAAARFGCLMVEVDVKLTADGRPVLMHDDRLERTTDGTGAVDATLLDWLSHLDAGRWFGEAFAGERIPTLEEALDRALDLELALNLEIKPSPGSDVATAIATVETVLAQWPEGVPPPLLSSFSEQALAAARDAAPELPRGLLFAKVPKDWATRAAALDVVSVHVSADVDPAVLPQMKASGYGVAVYTVNEPAAALRLVRAGADAIITDAPDRVLPALKGW